MSRYKTFCAAFLWIGILLNLNHTILAQEERAQVEAVTKWLSNNAIPLRSVKAGGGFADLQPLKKVFQGVRIVGLGEATHGTREFFQFKHRLLEFLIKEKSFRVLAIETGYSSSADINDYVLGKSNDGAKALENQGFWVWDTKEMREMLDWMRSYNASVPADKKVKVVGFDVHYNEPGKQKILAYLRRVAPERVAELEAFFKWEIEKLVETAYFTKDKQERVDILAKVAEARTKYNELLGFLTLNEIRFVSQTSAAEFNQIHEYARVLAQLADAYDRPLDEAGGALRDYYMAENIKRLIAAEPIGTRIVVWAHNQHISTGRESEKYPYMGFHLRRFFGEAYYALGFSFNQGSFQARDFNPKANREVIQFNVSPAPEGSVDWYFARVGIKNYFINFRHPAKSDPVARWLTTPHPMRVIGSYYNSQAEKNYFIPVTLKQEFDGIVFFDKITRAHPNPSVKNAAGLGKRNSQEIGHPRPNKSLEPTAN